MGSAGYRINELAQLAGVSVRTLHHYESVGLVVPERLGNGYRIYHEGDVRRLQQVLLFRECGLPLKEIRSIMDAPDYDAREALEEHLIALERRKKELERLIGTVENTILEMEGALAMTDKERFEGLKRETIRENEERFGAEARDRHGDAAVDAANAALLAMDEDGWNDMNGLESAIIEQLGIALASGDPAGPEAAELAAMHARWIRMHWGEAAFNTEAYLAMVRAYLADKRFQAYYDERAGQGACAFLVEAVEAANRG